MNESEPGRAEAGPDPFQSTVADRALLPFLPMVYVAWADGVLTRDELDEFAQRVEAQGGLDAGCRARLQEWLDPENPPSPRFLQAILRTLRREAPQLPAEARDSLAALGEGLARLGTPESESPELAAPVREALRSLEEALGVVGGEASRELLEPERPGAGAAEVAEATFDPQLLGGLLDAPYGEIRDRVRQLLSGPEFGYFDEVEGQAYREQVLAWCQALARHGLGALSFPKAQGGEEDVGKFIAAFETVAFGDQSLLVKFGVQFGLFAGSIHQLGTEHHHLEYLADAASLELPGCFAMSETGHGSNVADLETTATFDLATAEFVIHTPTPYDRKDWIGNAALHARMATVFAQLVTQGESHGVHAFLVPIRHADGSPVEGVRIEDCGRKEGLNGVDNGRLYFDRVRVPRRNLLNRFGDVSADGTYESPIASPDRRFFTMLGTLVGGRVSVAGAALSAAKSGLAIAVRYGARRRQFGPAGRPETALLDYRSHQLRLMPRLATCYALDFAHKYLVRRFVARTEKDSRAVETLAAGIKAYASWHNIETLQHCREACGGQGYLAVNRISTLRDDTDVYATFEGDNTVLMQLVAKGRLTEFRHQFSDLRLSNLVRVLAKQAASVVHFHPILARRTSEEHLRDPEFQLEAMRHREEHLLVTAAGRLKARISGGQDSFEAFNECQDHLLALAHASVERVLLEQFVSAVEGAEDASLREILKLVCDLFALWRIDRDRGWFLEHGMAEGDKAKAVRKLVQRLAAEVRGQALPLVEAWRIPDELLAAPIAFRAAPGL